MVNFFIIHGLGGSPNENWFPWLKSQLENDGYDVYVPQFPTPVEQSLENWFNIMKDYMQYINEDTIFIGHSLGPAFILNLLERLDFRVRASFLVAGFTGLLNLPPMDGWDFDKLNGEFTHRNFNWDKIRQNCKAFYVLNSDDDPFVPMQKGTELANHLHTHLTLIQGGGHLNESSGYTRFQFLLEKIKEELEK